MRSVAIDSWLVSVDVVFWFVMIARDGVLLRFIAVIAGDSWLRDVGFWLRVRNGFGERRRRRCWCVVILVSRVSDGLHQSLDGSWGIAV